jgi:superoxide reductase
MKINKYQDINDIANETRRDYVDRHSPFITVAHLGSNEYDVRVTVGNEYEHPDDPDHYISTVTLYAGTTKIAEANLFSGLVGGRGSKDKTSVSFKAKFDKTTKLTAHAYCTLHGLWEGDPVTVRVND